MQKNPLSGNELEIVFAINERERDISWYNWTNMVHK
jgi:hypothetical protein